jgi:hypothetical protein
LRKDDIGPGVEEQVLASGVSKYGRSRMEEMKPVAVQSRVHEADHDLQNQIKDKSDSSRTGNPT